MTWFKLNLIMKCYFTWEVNRYKRAGVFPCQDQDSGPILCDSDFNDWHRRLLAGNRC